MASICQHIVIEATPAQVWAAVRDVGAVHRRLTPGYVVETRLEGDYRILTHSSGSVTRELIIDVDDRERRLAYAVVEGRMPLLHHHASMQVFADGENRSRLVWITDVLPNDLANDIRIRIERGLRS
jgi:Polyketide cyclase / dehydrase and lipid transport